MELSRPMEEVVRTEPIRTLRSQFEMPMQRSFQQDMRPPLNLASSFLELQKMLKMKADQNFELKHASQMRNDSFQTLLESYQKLVQPVLQQSYN